MADQNTPENNNEKFVRWQQLTIGERGKTINLFLGMSFATVGFVITQLIKTEFKFRTNNSKIFITYGTVFLLISIMLLIWLTLNRLRGFRKTTEIARLSSLKQSGEIDSLRNENDKIDKVTRCLTTAAFLIFGISESIVVVGFIIQVWDKY